MGEVRKALKMLVGIREGKRPSGRSKCRLQDNIKIDLKEKDPRLWTGFSRFRFG